LKYALIAVLAIGVGLTSLLVPPTHYDTKELKAYSRVDAIDQCHRAYVHDTARMQECVDAAVNTNW